MSPSSPGRSRLEVQATPLPPQSIALTNLQPHPSLSYNNNNNINNINNSNNNINSSNNNNINSNSNNNINNNINNNSRSPSVKTPSTASGT